MINSTASLYDYQGVIVLNDVIEVELSQREVQLLLKYAYPFDHEQAQLDSVSAKAGYHLLQFEIGTTLGLIGDLVSSARKIKRSNLLEELDELCSVLELAG